MSYSLSLKQRGFERNRFSMGLPSDTLLNRPPMTEPFFFFFFFVFGSE